MVGGKERLTCTREEKSGGPPLRLTAVTRKLQRVRLDPSQGVEDLCITASREGLGLARLRLASGPFCSALLGDSALACFARLGAQTVRRTVAAAGDGPSAVLFWRVQRTGTRELAQCDLGMAGFASRVESKPCTEWR